ncbi:MAG TPA: RNA-binding transcriptional accessory protein [Firmicutes bacterium]|jgi:protein Tex|nr:RNA-binding transcriptional accessory protein [Bacillota bacterium]
MDLIKVIALELKISPRQIESTVKLLDDGNTIPFIARYRKEATGELDEEKLRDIEERLKYLRNLEARKEEVLKSIEEQGKLTPELAQAILEATKLQEVEDLYRPYKQKKRTRAMIAKERGLEPLAELIWSQQLETGSIEELAAPFIDPEKGVEDVAGALAGARDIIAEKVSDDPDYRKVLREYFWEQAVVASEAKEAKKGSKKDAEEAELDEYRMYADYKEPLKKIPPHRILALNRGEKEEALKVTLEAEHELALTRLQHLIVTNPKSIFTTELEEAISDGYKRLLFPSLERELRTAITETAEEHAIKMFGLNLRNLILQPPVNGLRVMGLDPGYRTGCKLAVVDETGKLLDTGTIYPHPPVNKWEETLEILEKLVEKHKVSLISIGNGTASRETETLAVELIHNLGAKKTAYCIVSEAGASVYSASKLAKEEFPELDVSIRGAVSIARRIQDPLAELVKIDPKSIGVGLYQHDVDQKKLGETLGGVVESCVNYVGVDLNTASPALLQYVAGLQPAVAKNVIAYRDENGKFKSRSQLKKVKRLGDQAFVQAAGFLKITDGEEPLDATAVHPESYEIARNLLKKLGFTPEDILNKDQLALVKLKLQEVNIDKTADELGVGKPTLKDIVDALAKPGRDPREDLPKPIFRNDVLKMEDLKPGMMLTGTVRNVIDFGAFVDIGVKQDGLVHVSELSDKFVKNPTDVVAVGDIVEVRVKEVDLVRKRIALSMKKEASGDAPVPRKSVEGSSPVKKPVERREAPKKTVVENVNITSNSMRDSFLKAGFKVK